MIRLTNWWDQWRTARKTPRSRLDRAPSKMRLNAFPWGSVMLASMATLLPVIASAPVMPPIGFMLLLGWHMLRPGTWPVWAGLPLGLFDDLFSGQPFGSAMALYSLALLLLEVADRRFMWRDFWQDWILASLIIGGFLLGGLAIANWAADNAHAIVLLPQFILSVSLYPVIVRVVSWLDRKRLYR